jgi:type IV pilus assembly protein PilM
MSDLVSFFSRVVSEPPPELVYEISETGIAMLRLSQPAHVQFHSFEPGVISASPVRDNVLLPDAFADGVRAVTPTGVTRRRRVVLLLPDYAARVSVLDFDKLPDDPEERQALVRFRMKKSVPFDMESAALSYFVQAGGPGVSVVAAVSPIEIIARYEAPFRALNLHPGIVTLSFLAALNLAPVAPSISLFVKLSGRALTVVVLRNGQLQLIRSIEMEALSLAEIANDLFPTVVYTEDHFGSRAAELLICGFGGMEREAVAYFESSLEIKVRALSTRDAGLAGYIGAAGQKAAA